MTHAQCLLQLARAESAAQEALRALNAHVAALGIDSPVTLRAQSVYFSAYNFARMLRDVSANFPG